MFKKTTVILLLDTFLDVLRFGGTLVEKHWFR
jgi:hypothetical protein